MTSRAFARLEPFDELDFFGRHRPLALELRLLLLLFVERPLLLVKRVTYRYGIAAPGRDAVPGDRYSI